MRTSSFGSGFTIPSSPPSSSHFAGIALITCHNSFWFIRPRYNCAPRWRASIARCCNSHATDSREWIYSFCQFTRNLLVYYCTSNLILGASSNLIGQFSLARPCVSDVFSLTNKVKMCREVINVEDSKTEGERSDEIVTNRLRRS